jgi:hypothetical protein
MAVVGSASLALKRVKAGFPQFIAAEARRAGEITRDEVRDLTPIGTVVDPKTGAVLGPSGKLRRSIRPLPVVRTGPDTWITGAYSRLPYASFVEYGTRKHVINGRPYLAFWAGGQLVVTKRVVHPGSWGHHMFSLGVLRAEAIWATNANARTQAYINSVT